MGIPSQKQLSVSQIEQLNQILSINDFQEYMEVRG